MQILHDAGIHTVVSLCSETEAALPNAVENQFHCIRYTLPDSRSSLTLDYLDVVRVLKIIHTSILQQRPVYVHCLAGMERSPTICLAYLCLYYGYNIDESLLWLKQIHPRTMPTEQQLNVVRFLVTTKGNLQPCLSPSSHLKSPS
ncbi:MAG: dual specificity protein phosphatase family protein [Cyanothece sp. SIO2G6]|nr:dual specificity protein phosphatase family protein [Cyanothece sp. SIO2G6]